VGHQKGVLISLKVYKDKLPPDGTWNIRLKHSMRQFGGGVRAWITKSSVCESHFEIQQNEKCFKTISSLAFGKNVISVGSFKVINNKELKEAPYGNFVKRNRSYKEIKPNVLTFGKVSLMVPEHHDPFVQDGTSVSTALITRLITYIWENNLDLKSQTLKNALLGKAVNLTEYEYQWKGASQFRLEKVGTIITSLINKSRRKNEI
jgi:hypothetical protein